jgi:hypothetical protein
LQKDIQLISIRIYGTPQNEWNPINLDTHFIQMPFIRGFSFSFLDYIAKMVGKLNAPASNGFVGYVNTSEGKLILNIPLAMVKAMICPYSLAYDG